jgi:hypothetical protein
MFVHSRIGMKSDGLSEAREAASPQEQLFHRTYVVRDTFSIFAPWCLVTFTAVLPGSGRGGKLLDGQEEEEEVRIQLAEFRR